MTLKRTGIAVVIVHLLVVVPHSIAHTQLGISMSPWQNVYIATVILLAPLVSAILLWKKPKPGLVLLALSMAGSFIFGFFYHFIATGSDNVRSLHSHPWTLPFQLSAVLLAVTELAGTVIGLIGSVKKVPGTE